MKEDNWGRLKIVQGFSCLNRTLCWFSIFFSFIVRSEKEGLALGSSSQHSFIILYLSRHKNYAWYDEQQFFRSIPIIHFRVILSLWCKARLSAKPFAVAALDLWKSLPDSIRSCDNLSTFKSDLRAGLSFLTKAYYVNTAIFILTFTFLLFNSLFICLKSEIFTYCLECGVRRLGQGWIGAIQIFNHYYSIIIIAIIIIITIIIIYMNFFFLILIYINLIFTTKLLHLVSFWKREFLELGSRLLEQKEFQKGIVVIFGWNFQ